VAGAEWIGGDGCMTARPATVAAAKAKQMVAHRPTAERAHTVCILCIMQYLLMFGASALWMSATITALIFLRDFHLITLTEELVPVVVPERRQ
jgi:hypothetical protein